MRRHRRCALGTGVQTCALPICDVVLGGARNLGEVTRFVMSICWQVGAKIRYKLTWETCHIVRQSLSEMLMLATEFGHVMTAEHLLQLGASVNAKKTVRHVYAECQAAELFHMCKLNCVAGWE